MIRVAPLLALTLAVTWLALSLLFKTQLLILGVLSVAFVMYWALRLGVLSYRGQPLHVPTLALLRYWVWLIWQIFLSNLDVSRTVLARDMKIEPYIGPVEPASGSDMDNVIYANSITLTPGTTAINFTPEGEILVHALQKASFDELVAGEMRRRVAAIEAPPGSHRSYRES